MGTSTNIHHVESSDHFKELLSRDLQRVSLLYFWAPWAEPCKQMTEVVVELSRKYEPLLSLQIEAEVHSEIAESFDIESVPAFLILRVRYPFTSLGIVSLKPWLPQPRATLYSPASQAQMPPRSLKPSRNIWPRPFPSRHFLIQISPLRLRWLVRRQRQRHPRSLRSAYVDS